MWKIFPLLLREVLKKVISKVVSQNSREMYETFSSFIQCPVMIKLCR